MWELAFSSFVFKFVTGFGFLGSKLEYAAGFLLGELCFSRLPERHWEFGINRSCPFLMEPWPWAALTPGSPCHPGCWIPPTRPQASIFNFTLICMSCYSHNVNAVRLFLKGKKYFSYINGIVDIIYNSFFSFSNMSVFMPLSHYLEILLLCSKFWNWEWLIYIYNWLYSVYIINHIFNI